MIPRYTRPEMAELWSQTRKYETWLEVELAACEAMEQAGTVPAGTAAEVREKAKIDAEKIDAIEAVVKHDVIAFLTNVEESAGPAARWLHLGMTSYDVVDTALSLLLRRASLLVIEALDELRRACKEQAERHRKTVMVGRTHGVHAEPITLGTTFALWYAELGRNRERLVAARKGISVGKLSGAVGTYAHLDPKLEEAALRSLGLIAEPISTQVIQRDRHAALFQAMALTATTVEKIGLTVRHLQRTEVGELFEAFTKGQKGSSAMPHKRNPILSENLCGQARLLRSWADAALENNALWHERDISHSSVERVIAPDATATLQFMLHRAATMVASLEADPEAMKRNLELTGGSIFSEGVLLALVHAGMARQEGYVLVQRNAMKAREERRPLREVMLEDAELLEGLGGAPALESCFDLDHVLRHVDAIIDRALEF
jgi:adenylosuccinate lyase